MIWLTLCRAWARRGHVGISDPFQYGALLQAIQGHEGACGGAVLALYLIRPTAPRQPGIFIHTTPHQPPQRHTS